MSDKMHIGWGDSLCGEYDMSKEGSSTLFPDESTCEKCLAIHNATLKPSLQSTNEAQAAEVAELKTRESEISQLYTEKAAEATDAYAEISKLNAEIAELRKAIQAIDDIVYEECEHGMMAQIWAIIETVKTEQAKDATP